MARLIDADELHYRMCKIADEYDNDHVFIDVIVDEIANAPSIDAVPLVHSFWDDSGRYMFPSGRKAICCDICKCALSVGEYNRFKWNYCPVCGAKMDGERRTDE